VLTREEMEKEHPLELEEIEKSELKNDENGAPITVTEAKIAGINKEINVSKNDGRKDE
jgi:hypothetical protein